MGSFFDPSFATVFSSLPTAHSLPTCVLGVIGTRTNGPELRHQHRQCRRLRSLASSASLRVFRLIKHSIALYRRGLGRSITRLNALRRTRRREKWPCDPADTSETMNIAPGT